MSYNRAYLAGDQVRVEWYTPGLSPLPTLGPCTVAATVVTDSVAANWQVEIAVEGYPDMLVYKDRVTP